MVKKNVLFLAAALVLCFAACNKDDEPEPNLTTFHISVTNVQDDYCNFSITPSTNSVEWMYMLLTKEHYQDRGIKQAVQGILSIYGEGGYTYTYSKNKGMIKQGKYSPYEIPDMIDNWDELYADTEYALCVFQVRQLEGDKIGLVGEVASQIFHTLPLYWVDLGLPSGLLWKCREERDNGSPLWVTYSEASQRGTIPTIDQWKELIENTGKYIGDTYISIYSDSNTGYIILDATGMYNDEGESVSSGGKYMGYYWSSSEIKATRILQKLFRFTISETSPYLSVDYNRGRLPDSKAGVMLVMENPYKEINSAAVNSR